MVVRTQYGQPANYNATPPTLSDGESSALNVDVNGNLKVVTSGGGIASSVQITDGTNVVNVLKSDGTAAGQDAMLTAGTYLDVPYTTTTAQAVGITDVGDYKWVSVHNISNGGSAIVNFQGSNDNSAWVPVQLVNMSTSVGPAGTSISAAGLISTGPLPFRYFRLNVTGIVSGTTAGVIHFSAFPTEMHAMGVSAAQNGAWTVGSNSATGSAVPANAFYVAARDNSSNLTGLVMSNGVADGSSGSTALGVGNFIYNGSSFDRFRSNTTGVVVAAGTTSTQSNVALTTFNASKLIIVVNVTAGAGSLIVTINGSTSSSYVYPILVSASLSGVAATALRVFPGATPSANLVSNDAVPRNVTVTAAVTGTITYGIDYILSV